MTPYLYFSILLTASVGATTFRKNNFGSGKNYEDSGENYSAGSSSNDHKSGYSVEGKSSPSKREYSGSYDGDDYIPPVGIQHNNDYSGLGDGYNDGYTGPNGGSGATSYSHVVSEHRPVHRYQPSRGLRAESTNIIETPVPLPIKVPIPVVPAFDRPVLPLVPIAPVARVLTPVKYPIQFFKPISYLTPEKTPVLPKNEQPEYLLTKVPLVYHATYSEGPRSSSGFGAPIPGNHQGATGFNHGFPEYNHASNNFNQGSVNFNHPPLHFNQDFNNVHRNLNHLNGAVTTPGTPSFHFNHPPPPLVPTPTPYNH